jgi:hypothetical protein
LYPLAARILIDVPHQGMNGRHEWRGAVCAVQQGRQNIARGSFIPFRAGD